MGKREKMKVLELFVLFEQQILEENLAASLR